MGSQLVCRLRRLKEGQIFTGCKIDGGYHIIMMISRSGDDAIVSHILRIHQSRETELNEATAKLDRCAKNY